MKGYKNQSLEVDSSKMELFVQQHMQFNTYTNTVDITLILLFSELKPKSFYHLITGCFLLRFIFEPSIKQRKRLNELLGSISKPQWSKERGSMNFLGLSMNPNKAKKEAQRTFQVYLWTQRKQRRDWLNEFLCILLINSLHIEFKPLC